MQIYKNNVGTHTKKTILFIKKNNIKVAKKQPFVFKSILK